MDIDFSALGQKVVFLFTNLPDFAIYIYEFNWNPVLFAYRWYEWLKGGVGVVVVV